jgi:hypothetical protein
MNGKNRLLVTDVGVVEIEDFMKITNRLRVTVCVKYTSKYKKNNGKITHATSWTLKD